ncbi:MAG: peptide-methionine (S)-S-oxide reductase MsrA, partial [Actinomycetia bacterium]|nr:peptide-methionine (S)-S-oxide reductase MsrA [Actinomycetes bacterium]
MGRHRVYLAGGCFWGTEAYLAAIPGVLATRVGYANGHVDRPSYEQVCTGTTGAAETVEVVFDDTALALDELLVLFFEVIDPVAVNRQGNDAGTQYRTGVYWTQPADEPVVRGALAWLALACDGEDVAVE